MESPVSYQEKRSLVSFAGNLLASVIYFGLVLQRAQAGGAITDDPRFWATAILLAIPVYIVIAIIFQVLFVVANVVATRREEPDITDELDRLIDLKAVRNLSYTFFAGIMLAMLLAAFGRPLHEMFLMICVALVSAGLVLEASTYFYYRRGV
jgi:hypothetical protein